MPHYVYVCPKCSTVSTLRRLIGEMDDPADCLACGQPMTRRFTPNSNFFIPLSFKAVLTGGVGVGGGQLSWSDFHDYTEKELAHMPNVEPFNRAMSQPGVGGTKKRGPASNRS